MMTLQDVRAVLDRCFEFALPVDAQDGDEIQEANIHIGEQVIPISALRQRAEAFIANYHDCTVLWSVLLQGRDSRELQEQKNQLALALRRISELGLIYVKVHKPFEALCKGAIDQLKTAATSTDIKERYVILDQLITLFDATKRETLTLLQAQCYYVVRLRFLRAGYMATGEEGWNQFENSCTKLFETMKNDKRIVHHSKVAQSLQHSMNIMKGIPSDVKERVLNTFQIPEDFSIEIIDV